MGPKILVSLFLSELPLGTLSDWSALLLHLKKKKIFPTLREGCEGNYEKLQ